MKTNFYPIFSTLNKWDTRYMEMAKLVASWSKDPSTQCGAVITDHNNRVVSVGFNGFAKGVNDDSKFYDDRQEKYRRVIHAEKNAILFAQRDLTNCTMYVTPMPPCAQCAGMIIQSGIIRVVTNEPTKEQLLRWGNDFDSTKDMFQDTGIDLFLIPEGN